MPDAAKKLFLLDAYALIYRAHFAFTKNPRINSKGQNTSVPFGFTNTLLEVLQKQKPSHIAVAFDTAAATFRDEMFEDYKANRQETPEDIRSGIPIVKEIIRGFNIPILEKDGYEADDIIGTLSLKAAAAGFDVFMMTPDKDFGQIVRDNIKLYKPAYMGNAVDILGPAEVCEKWDIARVEQVVDMLGLQGDTSDNIPGIPGVGPKTAADLLKQYDSVENVVAHAHELKGKLRERVEQYGEQAILSKKLAAINTETPVAFDEEMLKYKGPNESVLKPIFDELEFKTLLSRVFSGAPVAAASPATSSGSQLSMFGNAEIQPVARQAGPSSHTKADTANVRNELREKLSDVTSFGIAVVTDKEQTFDFQVLAIVISPASGSVYWIPSSFVEEFRTYLENPAISKIGHDLKGAVLALRKLGINVKGQLFDTMLGHYLIEPEASHALDVLSTQFLSVTLNALQDDMHEQMQRTDIVMQIRDGMQRELEDRHHSLLMRDVEMPLVYVLASMEYEGVKVNEQTLRQMSDALRIESEKVQSEIFEIAGMEFNIGSPRQLGEVLFDRMKLADKAKKTKTGQYATGEEILIKLADEHAIARKILEFREYEKLRSTYLDALPRMVSQTDGRIHSDFRQAVAATGRLSSNNPNLQNIPIRTEKGRQIRSAFVPRSDEYLFMSADYSQIELRIAAAFAHDETMIEAFRNKRDIHTTTAAKVFRVPIKQVTPDMRRKAKEVNFGILYGSTAFGLSQNLRISKTEGAEIIESYFKEFPGIKRYMDDAINHAREKEYVETILGRRRYLRDINSRNITTRGFAERNAINAPIQGSAADIIKIAMVNIHRWLEQKHMRTRMILQVHDELVFDVHKDEVEEVKNHVVDLMSHAVILDVPMEVEVGIGQNWLEAH